MEPKPLPGEHECGAGGRREGAMRILVLGAGGREHALCWTIGASPLCDKLFCAPGNGGIAEEAECVKLEVADTAGILAFCAEQAIDFVVVGPEAPLVGGLVDRLAAAGVKAFGPSQKAAELEGSKAFTKRFCNRFAIPTARYAEFSDDAAAERHIRAVGAPIVVKADGLAAGKAVVVAASVDDAVAAARAMLGGRFGAAGRRIVVEECLAGEELSFFALCDGRNALAMAGAQDHKRVGEGDTGPNTGGMGAYSPPPMLDEALSETIMARIVRPTVAGMAELGRPYRGVLFAGLMLTAEGPKLLEYNVRFGDPETQVLLPRLMSDLVPALVAAADGVLDKFALRWRPEAALTVVLAARGYPGPVTHGSAIAGLADAARLPGVMLFHAGTLREGGRLRANGGRVLNVTAVGRDLAEARTRAYAAIARIDWPDGFCRRDIGARTPR